jgi:hypothetical protein
MIKKRTTTIDLPFAGNSINKPMLSLKNFNSAFIRYRDKKLLIHKIFS